ncbi:MAG: redoxin domain-containing protein [Gammaproteobacteria bacterium]|nr:redoxin domain-containing protein [Gammaproteobacteria bacterium]MYK29089.1 redoxin domain-containing protein [Gammaproteobacteria bacterium]
MDEFLIASNLVLWAGLILLAGLVYALARQVGALFERIAPAGALMVNEVLKPGDSAPEITVEALNGAALTLGGEPESGAWPHATLIFFLAPDCPVCKTLLPVLRSVAKSESWVDIVLASDGGSAAEHVAYVAEQGIGEFPYVLSEGLGRSYGVGKLPYAVLIDERGRIASLGLVNSREHLESLFEAKERQAPSIQHYMQQQADGAFHQTDQHDGQRLADDAYYEAEVPAGGTHS